jgi:hypothetical protein
MLATSSRGRHCVASNEYFIPTSRAFAVPFLLVSWKWLQWFETMLKHDPRRFLPIHFAFQCRFAMSARLATTLPRLN